MSRAGGSLWRHGDFMRLWSAETVSQLGTQVTMLALPLTAILLLDATPFQVGALSSVEFAPFLLVGLPAGVWVDRMRRRPILIAGDLGRALVLGSIPLAYWLDALGMPHLYVAGFAAGVCTVFFDVAYQSYLPSLVERDQLTEGNAKLEISRSGAQLAGPGLAGLLVQLITAPVAILADAISYIGSAACVMMISRPEPDVPAPAGERRRMRTQIAQGLSYVLRHPLLRPIAICTSVSNLFFSLIFAILVLFAVRELGLSAGTIGVALALGNTGFLIGAFLADRVVGPLGLGRTIIGSAVVFGISGFLFPFATPARPLPLLVAGCFLEGLGSVIYNVNQVSLRQAITQDRMQGRMNATMRFVVWGTMPVGALLGGALGGWIGLRATLWVGAVGGLFAFIPPLLSPIRTLREVPRQASREVEETGARAVAGAGGPPEQAPASIEPMEARRSGSEPDSPSRSARGQSGS